MRLLISVIILFSSFVPVVGYSSGFWKLRMLTYQEYRVYHLKRTLTTITCYMIKKWNQEQAHSHVIDSTNLPSDIRVKVTLVARPLLKTVAQKLCSREHGVFSSRSCVHSRWSLRIEIICSCSWNIFSASIEHSRVVISVSKANCHTVLF
jgi:hypothetical protein